MASAVEPTLVRQIGKRHFKTVKQAAIKAGWPAADKSRSAVLRWAIRELATRLEAEARQ